MIFQRNIFPFYHTVSDQNLPHISNLYRLKSVDQFQRELDFFQKYYQDIALTDLITLSNEGKADNHNFFHLSFDDGLKENAGLIAEILMERKLNATFFINPNFIGNQEIFYRYKIALIIEKSKDKTLINTLLQLNIHDTEYIDQMIKENKIDLSRFDLYMNEDDISHLIKNDFTIGAHSLTHPYYKHISLEEQILQTNKSIDIIQEKFNLPYRVFSFPFTDHGTTRELFAHIKSDITFGTAGIKDDEIPTHFQRIPMDECTEKPNWFIYKNLVSYRLKKMLGKNIVTHG